MKTTITIPAFIILVVILIASFASLIPQVESPAPEVLEISDELSGTELAELGHTVFESPETGCLACHAIGREGLRAPDLAGIGGRASEQVPGQSAEAYLRESIEDPCAFVVEGYDCIMPPTLKQTLGPAKVAALIAFLQSQGGEITVSYSAAAAEGESSGGTVGIAGVTAEEIITNVGCAACHTIEAIGAEGVVGPDLSTVGARLNSDEIRLSLLTPDAVIADECPQRDEEGNISGTGPCLEGLMPKGLGDRLSATQLETLVTFLSTLE